MPFDFERMEIKDVILVTPRIFEDERGFFAETYKKSEFVKNGIEVDFCQDNHSKSTKGVIRGLHYQANPCAQAKLVRCTLGEVFDVAVDIRKGSKTFGKWVGVVLSAKNKQMLYIPEGFAHGFEVLSDEAEIVYKTSAEYAPTLDRGIIWNDETISVAWKNPISPILSEKDKIHPKLNEVKDLL